MRGQLRWLLFAVFLLLCGCLQPREAQIVGAVVVAELSQRENALPAEIAVNTVEFENPSQARVEATQRIPGIRVSGRVNFVCEVARKQGRWTVESVMAQEH